jgi:hypothetical protein
MKGRAVKEAYERGGYEGNGAYFFYEIIIFLWGSLGFAERGDLSSGVRRISSGGTGLLEVLGTGARISI